MNPMLLTFKKLMIKPNGMITGGFLQYSADDGSGVITYNGEVDVHFLFFSRTFPVNGNVVVDPKMLLSANAKEGTKYDMGDLQLEIVKVENEVATANVSVTNTSVRATGVATFDLKAQDISLLTLKAQGSVLGYNVTLEVG